MFDITKLFSMMKGFHHSNNAAQYIVKLFQTGRLGKVTLDTLEDAERVTLDTLDSERALFDE